MGGPGEIVEVDESYFRGKRKRAGNRRGRLLLGDFVPPARANYGNVVNGPWVFGLVHKRQDGLLDRRFFKVHRRDGRTLLPIIQKHVSPGRYNIKHNVEQVRCTYIYMLIAKMSNVVPT